MLNSNEIAKMLDHSLLQPYFTDDDIRAGCEIALKYGVASVCARPSDMNLVSEMLAGSSVAVSTVIGFPHGSNTTRSKVFEAERAIDDGATELDMVLNIGKLKSGDAAYVESDIRAVVEAAHARGAIVKVILENCYLTDDEKRAACEICEAAGADYVKTSAGYGTSGAKVEDLELMRGAVSPRVKVKAAGGLRTLDAVMAAKAAGADRCGVSATESIMKELQARASL
jgi:deoxyribose-phosphate aldolase